MHITFAYSVFVQYESSTYKCSLWSMRAKRGFVNRRGIQGRL
jgi:hypothetical protein